MCFHDSTVAVSSLSYSFDYSLTEIYPSAGGTRTDVFTSSFGFTLTRKTLASASIISPLNDISGLAAFLNPGEFFLLSSCCCPCNWTMIPNFATPYAIGATQTRNLVFPIGHIPPGPLNGTVTFDGAIDFTILPNVIQYPDLCGNNVTYTAQSIYWPTFDGVTPLDPAYFTSSGLTGGIDVNWPIVGYTGDPSLNPGGGTYSGGSVASPFFTNLGYFLWYDPTTGPPPTPIPGVTGSGNGFRNPCNPAMNFNQTVSWTMTGTTGGGVVVSGTGTGSIAIAFVP